MMQRSKSAVLSAMILTLFVASATRSQEKPATAKQVEARLKSAQRPRSNSADEAMSAILRTRRFERAAISPDGKKVVWVETVIAKNGAPTGDTTIFIAETSGSAVLACTAREIGT